MKALRGKLTYANVVATLALILSVGGASALAATQLAKNSVGTKQLKKNAVTAAKIKKGAVTAAKLGDRSVTAAKLDPSALGTVPSAKTLDGVGPTAFSRAAGSGVGGGALIGGGNGIARRVTITAPQDGFLLAIASADVAGFEDDELGCILSVDGKDIDSTERALELDTGNRQEDCGTNALVPAAAGKHTVDLEFTGLDVQTNVEAAELDVVFVPFAG